MLHYGVDYKPLSAPPCQFDMLDAMRDVADVDARAHMSARERCYAAMRRLCWRYAATLHALLDDAAQAR